MSPTKIAKKSDKPLLGQILDLIPYSVFSKAICTYQSDKHCHKYKTYDQLVSMMFGQLNKCHSLREIAQGISISPQFLSDIGLEQSPAKSTMSDGNAKRDWQVFERLYFGLLEHFSGLFSKQAEYKVINEIKGKHIKLVDASIMSVCLNLFPWAKFRTAKGGIKMHVSLDEASMIPDMIHLTEAKVSDRRGVDNFRYPKDTIVVDDRGYFDFGLFLTRIEDQNHFVTRIKGNTVYESTVEKDLPDGKHEHVLKDELIYLSGQAAKKVGIDQIQLRRVAIYKEDENKVIEVITNNLDWEAATIAELYKRRWQIEVFFKLIKQNLQIKTFLGTSENACKAQIFVAMIVYLLLELIRRNISKTYHCFGHFVTLVRVCLTQYNRLEYIVNEIQITVQKARRAYKPPDTGQQKLALG
ncbi:MAG: IS4 family transposase [Cyclobacteriaceae bacterium]|nr:IS4 family transposase [Cyclobacteriaceae bacterium]